MRRSARPRLEPNPPPGEILGLERLEERARWRRSSRWRGGRGAGRRASSGAWPCMLKPALIERVARLSEEMLRRPGAPRRGPLLRCLRGRGAVFAVEPCIPGAWEGFRLRWRTGGCEYRIEVRNPERRNRGVARALLDGAPVDPQAVPRLADGAVHRLEVTMGEPAPTAGEPGLQGAEGRASAARL